MTPRPIVIPPLNQTSISTPTIKPSFEGVIAFTNASQKYFSIALLDVKNGTIQNLSQHGPNSVSWAPDGSWLAFDGAFPSDEQSDIYKIRTDGSRLERLTNNSQGETDLAWSPDGHFIAYGYMNNDTSTGIALIDTDSLESRVISFSNGYQRHPTWSPDIKQIAYIYFEKYGAPKQLWIMDVNGKNAKHVMDFPYAFGNIDWSPDGKWLALISGIEPEKCGDIYVVKPDGSDLTRLTELSGCATEVIWSPDGKYLAFVGRNKATGNVMTWGWQIYVMDFDSKNIFAVTNEQEWLIQGIDWNFKGNSK